MHFFAFSSGKKVEPIMKVQITFQLMAVKNQLWRAMQIYGFFAHIEGVLKKIAQAQN